MTTKLSECRMDCCYVLDNGAYTAKMGFSHTPEPRIIPNCIMKVKSERRRPFIGDQIEECRDASGLFYILPFQRGFLVNWDVQKTVWDYIFATDLTHGKLSEIPMVITEPIMNFYSIQEAMDEIFFEEYDSCALSRCSTPDLAAYYYSCLNDRLNTCLVIDTGYSFTHVVPYIKGEKYSKGIKRIDVGGKVLTNHLKEIISYRQLHVMDETYVINQMKEDSCYISTDFLQDMKITKFHDSRNTIVRDYTLPDFNNLRRGFLHSPFGKDAQILPSSTSPSTSNRNTLESTSSSSDQSEQQSIRLNNERITVPEILFHPSDIGILQQGIAEAVIECINICPLIDKSSLLENIVVVGGNAKFPNFKQRLYAEIKSKFDEKYTVKIFIPKDPVTFPFEAGQQLPLSVEFDTFLVTKQEYEEYGTSYTNAPSDEYDTD